MAQKIDLAIFEIDFDIRNEQQVLSALNKIDNVLDSAEKNTLEYVEAMRAAKKIQDLTGKSSEAYAKELDKVSDASKNAEKSQSGLNKSTKQTGSSFSDLAGQAGELAQGGFGGLTSGAMNLVKGLGPVGQAISAVIAVVGAAYTVIAPIEKRFTALTLEVQRFSNLGGDALTKATADLAAMANVFGVSEKEILKGAKNLSKAFGISLPDAIKLTETGFLEGADANGDFLSKLEEYPEQFAQSGQSAEDFIKIVTTEIKEGVYSDKLVDSVKELGLRFRELTKAQKDALIPLGADFAAKFAKDIQFGTKSTTQLVQELGIAAKKAGLSMQEIATMTADLGGGPVEDAGGLLKVVELLTAAENEQLGVYDELGQKQEKLLEIQKRLTAEQAELAANFKGLSSVISNLADRALLDGINQFNKFIELIKTAKMRLDDFRQNTEAGKDDLKLFRGEFLSYEKETPFAAAMTHAAFTVEQNGSAVKAHRAELDALNQKAKEATFGSLGFGNEIENATNRLAKSEIQYKVSKEALGGFAAETEKAKGIQSKFNDALAKLPADVQAAKLEQWNAVLGNTSRSVNDSVMRNKQLEKLLTSVTGAVKEDAEALSKRKKAIDDQIRATEALLRITQNWNNQLEQSKIDINRDIFGFNEILEQSELDSKKLEQQADEDIKNFIKTAKDAGKSRAEIDAEVIKRQELLVNNRLLLSEKAFKQEQAIRNKELDDLQAHLEKVGIILGDFNIDEYLSKNTAIIPPDAIDKAISELDRFRQKAAQIAAMRDADISLNLAKGTISEKEAAKQRFELWKESLIKEIALHEEVDSAFGILSTETKQKQTELLNGIAENAKTAKEVTIAAIEEVVSTFNMAADVAEQLFGLQDAALDAQISKQADRVERARDLADQGNAEAFEQEVERLDALEKEKEEASKRAAVFALAEAAANAVAAVTKAASLPFPANIPAIISTIGAIGAGIAAVKTLTTPGFKDGVIDLQGPGSSKSDSIPARLSKGESVITAEGTMNAKEALKLINKGVLTDKEIFRRSVPAPADANYLQFESVNARLVSLENSVVSAIKGQPVTSLKVTRSGILTETKKGNDTLTKLNNRR